MNTFISKFAIIPPKKQVVKIRKIEADSDSNGDENHSCSRPHFLLHVNHPQLLKRNIYFCIYFYGLWKWKIYVNAIHVCTSAKTRRFSPVAVRLTKHRPVPGRRSSGARTAIVRCPDGHRPVPGRASADWLREYFKVPSACQTSYDARTGTVGNVRYKF